MDDEVLFQITKAHLDTGLRGFPVGNCFTSYVHPEQGLFYGEHKVAELASWEPERVIFLLYHGYDAPSKELEAFKTELKSRAQIDEQVIDHIEHLPKKGHPMALYSAAILILGMFEGREDYKEDCLNLIAKIPQLTATVINYHAGWGKTPPSRPELGYMDNFAQMLNHPEKNHTHCAEILSLFNILHYDHGGGNLSTFVGKAVASGLEEMYGSIAASMNALAGPRHGRANQECLQFVAEMHEYLGDKASEGEVENYIRNKLNNKELVYGFGHAVLRVEDPRATVMYQVAEKYYPSHPLVRLALIIRKVGTKVMKENPKIACPYPNVDAISGTLLTATGFPFSSYYTILFGLARAVGIAIQILDERLFARGGKGTPIVRPKFFYKKK